MRFKRNKNDMTLTHEFKKANFPQDTYISWQAGSMGGKVIDDGKSLLAVSQYLDEGVYQLLSYDLHDLRPKVLGEISTADYQSHITED